MATMEQVGERLAVIERSLSLVTGRMTTAFDDIPPVLYSAQLPAFVNVPGRATRIPEGAALLRLERIWTAQLFIAEWTGAQETETLIYPVFQAVEDAFFARKSLEWSGSVLNGLVEANYGGDQGVGPRPYPLNSSNIYLSVFFDLRIVTLRRVALKLTG